MRADDHRGNIEGLLAPLIGRADDDDEFERYRSLDPNDEAKLVEILRERLAPFFFEGQAYMQTFGQDSLRFALRITDYDFDSIIGGALLPMPIPDDPRDFFVAVWKALFPGTEVPTP
jgi:hypothetical protein